MGMEVPSFLLKRVMEGGFISGCMVRGRGREELSISHLLFVDNMIVFYGASEDQ